MTILNFRVLVDLLQHLLQPSTEADRSCMLPFLPFTSFQELLKMEPNEESNQTGCKKKTQLL
jgi:hypothetical protein